KLRFTPWNSDRSLARIAPLRFEPGIPPAARSFANPDGAHLWLAGPGQSATSRPVLVPATATRLTFDLQAGYIDNGQIYAPFYVDVLSGPAFAVATRIDGRLESRFDDGWQAVSLDLSQFRGRAVRLRFRTRGNDGGIRARLDRVAFAGNTREPAADVDTPPDTSYLALAGRQTLTSSGFDVPTGTARLRFQYQTGSVLDGAAWAELSVEVLGGPGGLDSTRIDGRTLSATLNQGWRSASLDLGAFRGQRIRLRFQTGGDPNTRTLIDQIVVGPNAVTAGRDGTFQYDNQPFRFIGANIRELAHFDASEQFEQVTAARHFTGARVIRTFVPHRGKSIPETIAALNALFASVPAEQDTMFILSLTNFYGDGDQRIAGDDSAYVTDGELVRLERSWFDLVPPCPEPCAARPVTYRTNYEAFVAAVVAEFSRHPRVFAWELGNELQAGGAGPMFGFARSVGCLIQGLDPNHMVTTGFLSTRHATRGATDMQEEIYGLRCDDGQRAFDFGSIHVHDNGAAEPSCNLAECPEPYGGQDLDYAWFRAAGMPYILGEVGFSGAAANPAQCAKVYPGGSWDGLALPATGDSRTEAIDLTLDRFFNELGADGALSWAFMYGPDDNGSADWCRGLAQPRVNTTDKGVAVVYGFNDWDALTAKYLEWSGRLKQAR
ncbi:MAG TPA: hypothetical protein VD886_01595, partial [Herpetosiphonaceae bacterium]|nr:hypothetical protein [Herpetosiphonaceae bacterium]